VAALHPLSFLTDTLTTTVWARAADALGHTSAPVSATFKLDLTPPSSKIQIGEYTHRRVDGQRHHRYPGQPAPGDGAA